MTDKLPVPVFPPHEVPSSSPFGNTEEPDFSGFLIPPAGPPPSREAGPQDQLTDDPTSHISSENIAGRYDLKSYTPCSTQNPLLSPSASSGAVAEVFAASAVAVPSTPAGGSALPAAELSTLDPEAPEFFPLGYTLSHSTGRAPNQSLSPHEKKRRKRARHKANKRLARDLAGVNIDASGESASVSLPGPSAKRPRFTQPAQSRPSGSRAPSAPENPSASSGLPATYSETVAGRPLVVSSRESGRGLGRPDLLKLESLVQGKLLQANPGFPVRNSGSTFSRGSIKIHCLDQRSHDWMKALINSSPDLGYLARSPEELPRLKKYGARVSAAVEVGSFIQLLCQCNPALDPTKLHIKGVAPLTEGRNIILGAEPEMAAIIDRRGGRFCFLVSEVILRAFGGGGRAGPRSSTPKATSRVTFSRSRTGHGPAPAVSPIGPGNIPTSRAAPTSGRGATPTSVASRLAGREQPRSTSHPMSARGGPPTVGGASATPRVAPHMPRANISGVRRESVSSRVKFFEGGEPSTSGGASATPAAGASVPRGPPKRAPAPGSVSAPAPSGPGPSPVVRPAPDRRKRKRNRRFRGGRRGSRGGGGGG